MELLDYSISNLYTFDWFQAETYEPTPNQPQSPQLILSLDLSRSGSVHHGASRLVDQQLVHVRLVPSRDV
jgi:hypothetical protein